MQARHIELTASGELQPYTLGVNDRPNDPVNVYIVGFNNSGFTSVKLHDGRDASGPVVLSTSASGPVSLNYEIRFVNGCYVEVAGTGTVSVWVV